MVIYNDFSFIIYLNLNLRILFSLINISAFVIKNGYKIKEIVHDFFKTFKGREMKYIHLLILKNYKNFIYRV